MSEVSHYTGQSFDMQSLNGFTMSDANFSESK